MMKQMYDTNKGSGQVIATLANSTESYPGGSGPVTLLGDTVKTSE